MSGIFSLTALTTPTAIALLGVSLTALPTWANGRPADRLAQLANPPIHISQSFRPPSRGQAPPSAGGATRGNSCLKGTKQLTSLIPQSRLGLTYSSNPTFFWYIPQSPATTAKFLLLNNDDTDVVYETTLNLPKQSGIVSFTLPSSAPPLATGKQYHWYFVVGCSQLDQSANPSVEGWIERVAPDATIANQLQTASPAEKAAIYATNGIWHDAIATLAGLRQTDSTRAATAVGWAELLKSVNLAEMADEPLLSATLSQK